jgi:hypothetical protein
MLAELDGSQPDRPVKRSPAPIFRVLLSESDMASLIERGIALAQYEKEEAATTGKPPAADDADDDDGW